MPSERINIAHDIVLQITDISKIQFEFAKPLFRNIFYRNKKALISNAEKIKFSKDIWELNPRQFCLDIYSETLFDKIILLVNNLKSSFEFKRDFFKDNIILAPKVESILKILSYQ